MAAGSTSAVVPVGPLSTEQSTMRLHLAVPASHMQTNPATGVLAGDSLTGHFADLCPISMRQGVAFVPLTRTPEAAVTLAESGARRTQKKRRRGSPTAPLERMTTSCG